MSKERQRLTRRDFLRLAGATIGATLLLSGKTNPPTEAARVLEDEKGKEILKDFFVVTGRVINKETGEGIGTSHKEEGEVMPVPDGNGVIVQLRQRVGQNETGLPIERIISQTFSGTHLPEPGSFLLRYQGQEDKIKKDLEENRLSVAAVDSSLRTLTEVPLSPNQVIPSVEGLHQTGFVGSVEELVIEISAKTKNNR